MNYKDFNMGDWIGHISGAIEDERELDGNEMRDLVEFLAKQKSVIDDIKAEIESEKRMDYVRNRKTYDKVLNIIKYMEELK